PACCYCPLRLPRHVRPLTLGLRLENAVHLAQRDVLAVDRGGDGPFAAAARAACASGKGGERRDDEDDYGDLLDSRHCGFAPSRDLNDDDQRAHRLPASRAALTGREIVCYKFRFLRAADSSLYDGTNRDGAPGNLWR